MVELSRRAFIVSGGAALTLGSSAVRAIEATDTPWAGEKIVDCHFHSRPTNEALIAHLDGAGIACGFVSATEDFAPRFEALKASNPGRIPGWARGSMLKADDPNLALPVPVAPGTSYPMQGVSAIDAVDTLRKAVAAGAKGFSETAGLVYADGPELQRLYALASELDVPIMMHFQQMAVPGHPRYGISGFSRLEAMLKKYPNTRFVCHASDFWGHIEAGYVDGGAYPSGKVHPGGLVERLLAEYPNIYGDCGAPSGMVQLGRDPEFTAGFVTRHRHKLIFGSDCGCADGRGGSSRPAPAPAAAAPSGATGSAPPAPVNLAARMAAMGGYANKCVAREILSILWKAAPRDVFRDLAWNNAHRVYKLPA